MGNLTGTPVESDEALVDEALASIPKPADVLDVAYEAGEDSEGEPAIWIWISTPRELSPSSERIERLTDYSTSIRDWLLDRGIKHWPYVRIHEYVPKSLGRSRNVAR